MKTHFVNEAVLLKLFVKSLGIHMYKIWKNDLKEDRIYVN